MSTFNDLVELQKMVDYHPGFVSLICDSDLIRLHRRRPPEEEDSQIRFQAEFFLRLWLYGDECPEDIKTAISQLPVGSAFRSAFNNKAIPLRRPSANSEPLYGEILSAPELDAPQREIWDALKARLVQFLMCDGIFPLVNVGSEEATVVAFNFTRSPNQQNKVFDERKELREWTNLIGKLRDSGDFKANILIAGEFPTALAKAEYGDEIGGSLGLALVLARERRNGRKIGWYWPLDVLATGAFKAGVLHNVEHISGKRAAGRRINAHLIVCPDTSDYRPTENKGLLTLPTGWAPSKCVQALSDRMRERGLDKLDFHRACLCLGQVLERPIKDLTNVEEIEEIETHLERCHFVFENSSAPSTASWRQKCDDGRSAAKTKRNWIQHRAAVAVTIFALIVLGVIWQWQQYRKAEIARLGRIESFSEQGRQELLTGSPLRALPFLAEAYREGGTGAGLRLLLAQGFNAIDSQVISFGGPSNEVYSATFSPDGAHLLTSSADRDAKIWNAATGKLLLTLPEACDRQFRPSFSPDGSLIATAYGRNAKIWQAVDGKLLFSLKGHKFDIKTVGFSADSKRLVTASVDDTANIWDVTEGKLLVSLIGHSATVHSAVFSPDDQKVLTISADKTAKVWDSTTGKLILSLPIYADGVRAMPQLNYDDCFSPNSSRILILGGRQVASVWSAVSGKQLAILKLDKPRIISVMFSPDSTRALAFSTSATDDNKIDVWDIESEKIIMTLEGHSGWINAIESNPAGSRFVSASWDTTARIWDALNGRELRILEGHKGFLVTRASYSPDGTRVVTVDADGYARVWDMTGGKLISSFRDRSKDIDTLAFSPDGARVITGSADPSITIWNAITWQPVSLLTNFTYPVTSAAFTRNGSRVVTASGFGPSPQLYDPVARVYDVATGRVLCSLGPHSNVINSVAFSPDGNRVYTTSDGAAYLWDVTSGNHLSTFIPPQSKWIAAAGFNSDSSKMFIATYGRNGIMEAKSDDGIVKVWDFETKRLISSFSTPNAFFYSLNFSRNGSNILTASADHNVTVWDTLTGKALTSLHANIPFGGLTRWNGDGSLILTTDEKTAKIWDAESGKLLTTLEGHTSRITFARFSGDSSHIATASEDGTIKIWDAHLETRAKEEIVRLLEARDPWRLSHGQLVPAVTTKP